MEEPRVCRSELDAGIVAGWSKGVEMVWSKRVG